MNSVTMADVTAAGRRSIRLRGWDYRAAGAYFVTCCTLDRRPIFGDIQDGVMHVNQFGEIVEETWRWLPTQYPHVTLDAWCVMPDHLHGIVVTGRGGSRTAPTDDQATNKSIGRLVGAFKTVSTKRINLVRGTPGARVWQRDFWDRVIRDDDELERIRDYIIGNAAGWPHD